MLNITETSAQNLVINPSFENDTIPYPIYWDSLINFGFYGLPCVPWFLPTFGSSDYVSMYWGGYQAVPNNNFGFSYAVTGYAFYGLGVSNGAPFQGNYREYISGILSDSLISGHEYLVSFYSKPASRCFYFTDDIGIYISLDSGSNYNMSTNLPYIPQIENPQGNMLDDTVNWSLISGMYTASGGEKFITIGNFKDDANTTIDSFNIITINKFSYYFIDDVSVIDCTAAGMEEPALFDLTSANPVTEELVFSSNEAIERAIVRNLLGEAVVKKQFTGPAINYRMNMANLPKGLYILEAESKDKRRAVRKVMKW